MPQGKASVKTLVTVLAAILMCCAVAIAQPDSIVILHTNDTHAHLLPYGPKDASGNWQWGGFARVATLIGMTRMQSPNTLVLDAGDYSVGDFMFQEYLSIPQLMLMKAIGYDAVALGNHEFDLYPSTLQYMLIQAGLPDPAMPVLCANLDVSGEPTMGYFVQPYMIKDYGNTRVGVVALLTESANQISNPSPVLVLPAIGEAQRWIDTLAAHDCDVVIILSHLGFEVDCVLAQMVSGADVIVGGHSHTYLPGAVEVNGVRIVQAGEFAGHVGRTTLVVESGDLVGFDYYPVPIDQSVPEEPTIAGQIQMLAMGIEADPRFGPVYSENLAVAAVDITKTRTDGIFQDTPMGNMIADAFRIVTGTDIAFQPQGFCGQTIYKGLVRGMDIFQAVPYGFDQTTGLGLKLVTFETNGMSILAGLEFAVYNLPYSEDFILHGSNIMYAYNQANPPGSRVDYTSVRINGVPIDPYATYTVSTSDAVVGFVSQIPGFSISNLNFLDLPVYTVVKDYMIDHTPVVAYRGGRVFDLAPMADPADAALLLDQAITQYIDSKLLKRTYNVAPWHLHVLKAQKLIERGALQAAWQMLEIFKQEVERTPSKYLDPMAAERLVYLAGYIQGMIAPQAPPAAKVATLPSELVLEQNYPNPFNPTTSISFSLPQPTHVSLVVYNILGERVATLVEGDLSAGIHTATWNSMDASGNPVASGVYFYRLETNGAVATRKMLLLQ